MDKTSNPPVRIEKQQGSHPGVEILRVHGPLEITNYSEFQEMMSRNEARVLLVDLTDVPYIDSAVLGSMVAMYVACSRNQRKYALVRANQRIQNMLTVSGVGEIIVTFPTIEKAEAGLA